jgi:hypothetical protein
MQAISVLQTATFARHCPESCRLALLKSPGSRFALSPDPTAAGAKRGAPDGTEFCL